MPDLNPILAGQQAFAAQGKSAVASLDDITKQLFGLSQDDVRNFDTMGANASLIETVKGNSELQVQNARLASASALGVDPTHANDIRDTLAKQLEFVRAEQQGYKEKIAQKQSVGFFDNPLEHVLNQLTINDDINKHNAAATVADGLMERYAEVNRLTQQSVVTDNQLTTSITQATIAAGAQNAALQAKILANKAAVAGLTYNQQGITTALTISSQMLQSQFSVFGAQQAQAHLNLAIEAAEQHRAEFKWKVEEKEAQRQTDESIWAQVVKGNQLRLGDKSPLAQWDARAPKAQQIIGALKSNSEFGKEYLQDYHAGEQGILSTSPARAYDMIKSMPVNLAPIQNPIKNLLEDAFAAVSAEVRGTKDKAQIMAAVDSNAKQIVDHMLTRVTPGDEKNVFNIPSITYLVQNSPELQKLGLVTKVLASRMAAGDQLSNPSDVFTATMKAVQAGAITYQEGVIGLTSIYQRGVQTNLAARNLVSFGITPSKDNDMFQYNVDIAVNPANPYGAKSTQDMTKLDVVSRAANTWLTKSAFGLTAGQPSERMIKLNIGANEVHKKGQFYPDLTVPYGDQK